MALMATLSDHQLRVLQVRKPVLLKSIVNKKNIKINIDVKYCLDITRSSKALWDSWEVISNQGVSGAHGYQGVRSWDARMTRDSCSGRKSVQLMSKSVRKIIMQQHGNGYMVSIQGTV